MKKIMDILNRETECNVFVTFELKTKLGFFPDKTYFSDCYIKDIWLYPYPTGWQKKMNDKKIISALEEEICKKAFITPDGYTLIHVGWRTIDCITSLKGTIDYTDED